MSELTSLLLEEKHEIRNRINSTSCDTKRNGYEITTSRAIYRKLTEVRLYLVRRLDKFGAVVNKDINCCKNVCCTEKDKNFG